MGIADRVRARAGEVLREQLGYELTERGEVGRLREAVDEYRSFRDEVGELGYAVLNYVGGRPHELLPERRRRIAQRSRIALQQDPLAGAEADLLGNFSLGRGVPIPDAPDEEVQRVIREAWTDASNAEKLTSFEAQRHRSHELLTQANLYMVLFRGGGRVRVAFLDADRVEAIVCDPEDEERPLYYGVRPNTRVAWDFDRDAPALYPESAQEMTRLVYYAHHRNLDAAREERERPGSRGMAPVPEVPSGRLLEGEVHHVRVNRVGRTEFGTPPWARTLRFMNAMTVLTESHVTMAQAASQIVAKRVVDGSPEAVARAASNVLAQTGEFAAATIGGRARPIVDELSPMTPTPVGGATHVENPSDRLEGVSLSSGSAQMQQSAQIVRAPISAASGFGQHYLGDACHDRETEVLTDEGWLGYDALRERARAGTLPTVAAYDADAEVLRYEEPSRFIEHEHDGDLVAFKGRAQDVLVTPNHRMLVAPPGGVTAETTRVLHAEEVEAGRWSVRAAAPLEDDEDVPEFVLPAFRKRYAPNRGSFPRREALHERVREARAAGRTWQGIRDDLGVSPATISRALGMAADRRPERAVEPERTLSMDAWLRWLGWAISEGSTGSGGVQIAQAADGPFLDDLKAACVGLGLPGTHRARPARGATREAWMHTTWGVQVEAWVREHVGASAAEKRVPAFVWGVSRRQRMILLRSLMHGDGACGADDRWEREGGSTYYSTSRGLADDVQRLALECGFRALRSDDEARGMHRVHLTAPGGRNGRGERDNRSVSLGKSRRVRYRGPVFCLTMPSGTMVTRRNGRVAFHGNSNANLATATSLELPTLMTVQSWQETLRGLLAAFVDAVIEEAFRAGRLRADGDDDPLEEAEARDRRRRRWRGDGRRRKALHLAEALDREEAERRTGRDLSYRLSLPYPGRRNLPDVTSAVTSMLTTLDPGGENVELQRMMFGLWLTEGMQRDDAVEQVDTVMPAEAGDAVVRQAAMRAANAPDAGPGDAAGGEQGGGGPPQNGSPGGRRGGGGGADRQGGGDGGAPGRERLSGARGGALSEEEREMLESMGLDLSSAAGRAAVRVDRADRG